MILALADFVTTAALRALRMVLVLLLLLGAVGFTNQTRIGGESGDPGRLTWAIDGQPVLHVYPPAK